MALVVETGAGLSNADAFGSLVDFKTYHDVRGNAYASYQDGPIENAIRRATDFLCRYYAYVGTKKTKAQALAWPRAEAEDQDGFTYADEVPTQVKHACFELAFRALSADLLPDLARGGKVTNVSVGGISVAFDRDAPVNKVYQTVDYLLRGLLTSSDPTLRVQMEAPTEVTPAFAVGDMDMPDDSGSVL